MHQVAHARDGYAMPKWHAVVCLCLALLLLYNPYMSAPGSTNGLNVRHPASNRATVGASELQHFSPADGKLKFSTHAVASVEQLLRIPDLSSKTLEFFPQVVFSAQQFFGSSLWFRPPPAP